MAENSNNRKEYELYLETLVCFRSVQYILSEFCLHRKSISNQHKFVEQTNEYFLKTSFILSLNEFIKN